MSCFSSQQSRCDQQFSPCPRRSSGALSLKSILIAYLKYKRTTIDTYLYPSRIVQTLHKRLCKKGICKCNRTIAIFNHVNKCRDLNCPVCKPLRSSLQTSSQKAVDFPSHAKYDINHYYLHDVNNSTIHRSKGVKVFSSETQSFGSSPEEAQPIYIHDETPLEIDTSIASSHSKNLTVDLSIYLGKSELAEEATKTDRNKGVSIYDVNNTLHRSKRVKIVSSETQSFGSSPEVAQSLYIHDETPRKIDTCIASSQCSSLDKFIYSGKSEQAKEATSILDFFTEDEIKEHLSSLGTTSDQDFDTNIPCDESMCNLCGKKNLNFAPKPIYCLSCNCRIKEGAVYHYTCDEKKASKSCFCKKCFSLATGILLDGKKISKSKLQKERNDVADDEEWVQCDQCQVWQHQICALYNDYINGNSEYVCPKCYLLRIKSGDHVPIQKNPNFGARNLPTTKLGDYIEKRLIDRLNQDRKERAKASQNSFYEVPGATDIVVRVVVSTDKLLKVNEQFSQIFRDVKYPSEFPYRSKVILLFQKIEGVDVCLFAMYVQEYGSECSKPNQRSVYISHLDSVKQFRPNINSASGEALRTFAYHEILIGYLDYCKKRGFETAYIWSCPPMKGDDYIFYCHPKAQKTPKLDSLRQWYKSMLRKAAKENIVVGLTNFYNHYFVTNEESNIKVSAAQLPYFDGDYWSSTAIDLINEIEKETKNSKEIISRRTLRAFGHRGISEDETKDFLLMQQLGERILPSKDDFFMVRLQATSENYVAENTEDNDAIIETILFEDRNSFLSFCQGNVKLEKMEIKYPYQFDELRRAKHSSMMILYHLHRSIKKVTRDCGEKIGNI